MPGFPRVNADLATERQREAMQEIQRDRNLAGNQLGAVFAMLLTSPEAARHIGKLGAYCRFHTSLPQRLRESAILAAAFAVGFELEIRVHTQLAAACGVAPQHIDALRRGDLAALPEDMRRVTQLSRAVAIGGEVADQLIAAARASFGDAGAIDIATTAGYYLMLHRITGVLKPDA